MTDYFWRSVLYLEGLDDVLWHGKVRILAKNFDSYCMVEGVIVIGLFLQLLRLKIVRSFGFSTSVMPHNKRWVMSQKNEIRMKRTESHSQF